MCIYAYTYAYIVFARAWEVAKLLDEGTLHQAGQGVYE